MLVTPPFGASSSNIALWRAYSKPPVELVVADKKTMKMQVLKNNKLLYYDVDNKIWRCIMKAHKYWSIGAIVTMVGTFYTGYKGLKAAHKYFAFGSLICMIMAVYSGHKMISGNKRTRKQVEKKEVEE